ncbi:MAG: SPOR domain-containing protein [Candidatus Gastranaerophilales bacterium]|nr:SPOR domain-containing protein [Candidatus Gastranaerophilales bacterium]
MTDEPNNIPIRKKRTKNKKGFGYLYLFAFVFLIALAGLSYVVNAYSPDVDVTIGNNESLTLSESDMEVEIKSVDERLKWIQMEDEMPTVALRNSEKKSSKKKEYDNYTMSESNTLKNDKLEDKKTKKIPVPSIEDIQSQKADFKLAVVPHNPVVPKPKPLFTKVYLGSYTTIDEAMSMQSKISKEYADLNPFIKAVQDSYIVQIGSFSEEERAQELVSNLRRHGYNPKISYEK